MKLAKLLRAGAALGVLLLIIGNLPAVLNLNQVNGSLLAPKNMVFGIDDGPTRTRWDGKNNILLLAQWLHDNGIPGIWFILICHFQGQVVTDPRASMCLVPGDQPISVLAQLADYEDFTIGNHGTKHVTYPNLTGPEIVDDLTQAQKLLAPFQTEDGLHIVRCPGLQCFAREISFIQNDPYLGKLLRGPLDADLGGWLYQDQTDTKVDGGDWYCKEYGIDAKTCAGMYMRFLSDPRTATPFSGLIELSHVRTEFMTGYSPDDTFALDFHQTLIPLLLQAGYKFVPVDAIPGFLGNIQAPNFVRASVEFGSYDGDGQVVYGDISGSGLAAACKARGSQIWCLPNNTAMPQKRPVGKRVKFGPSSLWYSVSNPNWAAGYSHKFWLVDWDGDGKKDLVLPDPEGFQVLYSNGVGFSNPVLYKVTLPAGGWSAALLNTVRFGDLNGDGKQDFVALTADGVVGAYGSGNGFSDPVVLSAVFSASSGWSNDQYASTLQFRDLNNDGIPDVLIRGYLQTYVALGNKQGGLDYPTEWTRRFNDQQGWNQPAQYRSITLAKVNGKIGIAAGAESGIVFQEAQPDRFRFGHYRYLNNDSYSTLPNWNPDRLATQLSFADFDGSGNEAPAIVKADGIYAALIQIIKE